MMLLKVTLFALLAMVALGKPREYDGITCYNHQQCKVADYCYKKQCKPCPVFVGTYTQTIKSDGTSKITLKKVDNFKQGCEPTKISKVLYPAETSTATTAMPADSTADSASSME